MADCEMTVTLEVTTAGRLRSRESPAGESLQAHPGVVYCLRLGDGRSSFARLSSDGLLSTAAPIGRGGLATRLGTMDR